MIQVIVCEHHVRNDILEEKTLILIVESKLTTKKN
jgi:hypothetical protein